MTPETTLRDGDHTAPLPDVAELQADVAELRAEAHADARRIGRLEGLLRSLLVAGDEMALDLAALHFEARVSAQRWDGVAKFARLALEVGHG